MNDEEREMWVNNDEGLYLWWTHSQLSMRQFIRKNRDIIDKIIRQAMKGR